MNIYNWWLCIKNKECHKFSSPEEADTYYYDNYKTREVASVIIPTLNIPIKSLERWLLDRKLKETWP